MNYDQLNRALTAFPGALVNAPMTLVQGLGMGLQAGVGALQPLVNQGLNELEYMGSEVAQGYTPYVRPRMSEEAAQDLRDQESEEFGGKLPTQADLAERAYQEEAVRQAQQTDPFMMAQQPSQVQYDPQTAMMINEQIYGVNFKDKGRGPNPLVQQLREEFPRLQELAAEREAQQAANDPREAAQAMLRGTQNAMLGDAVPFTDAGEQTLLDTAAAQGFLQQLGRFEPR